MATVSKANKQAAERIHKARLIMDDWENVKERYKFTEVQTADGKKKIINPTWQRIEEDKQWLKEKLRIVDDKLKDPSTEIPFYKTDETHDETNIMYTASLNLGVTEVGHRIKLRTTYWEKGDDQRAFWTGHEFARFFLWMDDDPKGPRVEHTKRMRFSPKMIEMTGNFDTVDVVIYREPGVQSWDDYISFLNDYHVSE